ncbi:MAG: PEF-CTERM sorting domain-containing protein [Methanosarcinaceae archaeon]|nr:PEF-CTERM sorting domain-containing protein [Methanosarcinaceae archaeon]
MKKIVTILIAITLITMMGTAAADQINVYDTGTSNTVSVIPLVPGGASVQKDLVVSGFLQDGSISSVAHTLNDTISIVPVAGISGQLITDIKVEYRELSPSMTWKVEDCRWTQVSDIGGNELLAIRFSASPGAPVGGKYQIEIKDTATGNSFAATCIVGTVNVPEFPTIALPVAAILGLAFFFQRRREDE